MLLLVLVLLVDFAFYQQNFQLRCLWTCELKQKENFTEIYHCIPIHHLIVHIGEKQHILLHFEKLSLGDALENTCGKSSVFRKWLILHDKFCRHILKCAFFLVKQYIDFQKQPAGGVLKLWCLYSFVNKVSII